MKRTTKDLLGEFFAAVAIFTLGFLILIGIISVLSMDLWLLSEFPLGLVIALPIQLLAISGAALSFLDN